jgi:hypothetical protein
MLHFNVRRQDQNADFWMLLTNFPGRLQPLPSPRGWHTDVNHHKVRRSVANHRKQLDSVASLTHDLEAGAFEQARHPLTEQQLIFCQHYAHRRSISPLTVAPGPNTAEDESIVMGSIIG